MTTICDRCGEERYLINVGCIGGKYSEEELCGGCYRIWLKEKERKEKKEREEKVKNEDIYDKSLDDDEYDKTKLEFESFWKKEWNKLEGDINDFSFKFFKAGYKYGLNQRTNRANDK